MKPTKKINVLGKDGKIVNPVKKPVTTPERDLSKKPGAAGPRRHKAPVWPKGRCKLCRAWREIVRDGKCDHCDFLDSYEPRGYKNVEKIPARRKE